MGGWNAGLRGLEGILKIIDTQHAEATGLHLLFATGKRPTRAAVRDFAESHRSVSLSHDPAGDNPLHLVPADGRPRDYAQPAGSDVDDTLWVEFLREGLTFDLRGLAPGPDCRLPDIEHRFDLDQTPSALRLEALNLVPSHHLAGGQNSIPVAKGLVALARDLIHHFDDLQAVVWAPAQSVIGRRFFESVSTAWLEGGAFPALGLTAFRETIDGALQSVGLDYWIGQELRIEPPLSSDKVAATRLGVRIINQLVLVGGLEDAERIVAPDGSQLVMRPSRNRKFIRVWRE